MEGILTLSTVLVCPQSDQYERSCHVECSVQKLSATGMFGSIYC